MANKEIIVTRFKQIAEFTNLHTRVYFNRELLFAFNSIDIPIDYLDLYLDQIFSVTGPLEVVFTREGFFIIVLTLEKFICTIGPLSELPPTKEQIDKFVSITGCDASQQKNFQALCNNLANISLSTSIYLSCNDYYALTGIILNPSDILKNSYIKKLAFNNIPNDTKKRYEEIEEQVLTHNTLWQIEKKLCNALSLGSPDEIERIFFSEKINIPQRTSMPLRNYKNIFIMATTLASRTVVMNGISPTESMCLADYYINRCEAESSPDKLLDLLITMFKHFALLIKAIDKTLNCSDFVQSINSYIEQHMTEKISVEQMAFDLGMSRNTITRKFKNDTGLILSEYILAKKIDRAKYLLVNSDQSLSEISAYLGFSSQSHFQRVFKKYTNMTPIEFKNKPSAFMNTLG